MFFRKTKSQKPKVKNQCKLHPLLSRCFRLSTLAGFTLVELMVTIGIFIFMTALVVANYGSFNDGSLMTSMAYDVALTLRDAQSYGLNVKGTNDTATQSFSYPYGLDFNLNDENQMILFADSSPSNPDGTFGDGVFTPSGSDPDTTITTYTIERGGFIESLCVTNSPNSISPVCPPSDNVGTIDITFRRPDPNAIIIAKDSGGNILSTGGNPTRFAYAEIKVEDASKTSTRTIVVRETGEIAVQNQ